VADDHAVPVRVALSNDYELVLRGLERLLAPFADRVEVVAASTDIDLPDGIDVVLFDAFGRLPRRDRKLREVVAANPGAQVVVFSWDTYPPAEARAHGAVGWIDKRVSAEELADRLVDVHHGAEVEAHGRGDHDGGDWPAREAGLSAREAEMLGFVCRGLSNDEIAARAYLGVNTVKTYLRSAYRKAGISRRSQAVVWGLEHGLGGDTDSPP
jgi:NarL family two-component system response regulator LiaR